MIIVNQTKDMIMNFNNVESIDIAVDLDGTGKLPHEIYYETNSKREKLGTYSTEERAKEVLQEIVDTFIGIRAIENIEKDLTFDENTQVRIRPKVYYMSEK